MPGQLPRYSSLYTTRLFPSTCWAEFLASFAGVALRGIKHGMIRVTCREGTINATGFEGEPFIVDMRRITNGRRCREITIRSNSDHALAVCLCLTKFLGRTDSWSNPMHHQSRYNSAGIWPP